MGTGHPAGGSGLRRFSQRFSHTRSRPAGRPGRAHRCWWRRARSAGRIRPPKAPVRAHGNSRRQVAPPDEDQPDGNGSMEDLFNRFFGNGGPEMQQRRGEATGSGVVVDRAGYILTNNHVVDKADRIRVKFDHDPVEYDAKVVGVDAATDLAVIRVENKKDLTVAKMGNSDAVQVGDWAIAIGSPFGFQATVTAGIISARTAPRR